MKTIKLQKTLIRLSGNSEHFLNGLTSNVLDAPCNAFLTIHGRVVATFDQVRTADNEFYILISSHAKDALLNHVEKYLKLNKTQLDVCDWNVYFDCEDDVEPAEDMIVFVQKKGKIVATPRSLETTMSEGEFTAFRLDNSIPLHGVDYTDQMLLNISHHDYASFTKGCFLGQEPLSKVHNRSQPSWKLAVCWEKDVTSEQAEKMTSKLKDPETQNVRGFCFVPYV